jgi:pentatricopeptide repeat protein
MAIIACGRACRAAEAVDVFDRMLAAGLAPCLTTYTALMSLFCRVGALKDACIVFESMKAAGVAPNTITYSSLINGCEKATNLDAAVLYFDEMLVRPVRARRACCAQDAPRSRMTTLGCVRCTWTLHRARKSPLVRAAPRNSSHSDSA